MTLSANLTLSKNGRISKTAGYYVAFIALGMVAASLGPTLSGLAENTRTHLGQISFLFTARSLGYLVGSLFGGRLYDRKPGHPIIATVLGMMTVTMFFIPMISLLWLLTGVLLIVGIAEGILEVGGNTLLVWIHHREVGPFMNGLHFFFGVGAFLSPIIIAQVVLMSGNFTWAYWTLALLILPVAIWFLFLSNPTLQTVSKDSQTGQIHYGLAALIAMFLLLYVGAEVSFGGWIFTYAVTLNLADKAIAAYLTSAFWGSLTFGRLLSIPFAAHFRPGVMLLCDLAGCLMSVGIILLWSNSLSAVWIGALGLGLSMASIFPTMLSFGERRMTITGQVTSWFCMGAGIGAMSMPWLIGQLFESIGPRVMMLTIMFDLIVAVIVFVGLLFYSKQVVTKMSY